MVQELITAFLLGLIGGVIPGPVLTAIFTEILQTGFSKSLRIIFIAMFTETLVAVISLLVFSALDFEEGVFRGVSLVGAAILIWIATTIWKVRSLDSGEGVRFGFWKITGMILANGVLWTYWITICIPKAILLREEMLMGHYLFMALVQIGWLISTILAAYLFSRFRILLSQPRIIPYVFKVFALAFIYFAVDMVYKSLVFFMSG